MAKVKIKNDLTGQIIEVDENELADYGLGPSVQQTTTLATDTQTPQKVKIRNDKTGQVIEVDQSELGQYGLGGEANNAPFTKEQIKTEIGKLAGQGSTTAQRKLANWEKQLELWYPDEASNETNEAEQAKKENADNALTTLEQLYFGPTGEQDPIAFAIEGRSMTRLAAKKAEIGAKLKPPKTGSREDRLRRYNALLDSSLAAMAKAGGDVANIAVVEQMMQKRALGKGEDTPAEAAYKFQAFRKKLGLPESDVLKNALDKHTITSSQKKAIDSEMTEYEKQVKENGISPETAAYLMNNGISIPKNIKVNTGPTNQQRQIMSPANVQQPTQQPTQQPKQQRPGIIETLQGLVGTPETRDKLMDDFIGVLKGQKPVIEGKKSLKEEIGIDPMQIPLLSQILSASSGVARSVGEGPYQAIGGAVTRNPYDVGMGGGKTLLSLLSPQAAGPKGVTTGAAIGGGLGYLTDDDVIESAAQGGMEAAKLQALQSLITKIPGADRVIKPGKTAKAQRAKEAAQATEQGVKFSRTNEIKRAAKYILKQGSKDTSYMSKAEKQLLEKLVKNETISPTEAEKIMPAIRKMGRTLTNNPLRGNEGQAYNTIYEELLSQTKSKAPKVYQEIVRQSKLLQSPSQAKKFQEPLERAARKYGSYGARKAMDVGGLYLLARMLGIDIGGSGGGNSY